jgi:hypothetical protein
VAKEERDADDETQRVQIRVAWISVVGLVLASAVTALLTGGFGLVADDKPSINMTTSTAAPSATADGGNSTNTDTCVSGGVVVQGDVNCTKTTKEPQQPALTTADAGCGSSMEAPTGSRLRLKVLMYCAPEAVRGQYMYKLKVSVKNTGTKRLDIRPERFKLVWRTLNPSRWSPPPGGAYAPPRRVRYLGRPYWAISANVDGAAEAIPGTGGRHVRDALDAHLPGTGTDVVATEEGPLHAHVPRTRWRAEAHPLQPQRG